MKYGAVIPGRFIYARRNDGREFMGVIWNVHALPKGTLVTVTENDQYQQSGFGYRRFYLENCSVWDVYEHAEEMESAVC